MRTSATVLLAGALSVALVWLPLPGIWWHVVRWAYYLPIVSVSYRHGPIAGLFAGVAVSLFYAFVAASLGMGDMAWLLAPDLPIVGLFGGRLLEVWPRFKRRYAASAAPIWRAPDRISEPDPTIELNSLASIQTAAELLAEGGTSTDLRQELAGIISVECERLSSRIGRPVRSDCGSTSELHEADLAPIIDAAAREAEFVLCGRGIVVRNQSEPDLPPIRCNPDQMRELLTSLAMNAIQFGPAGAEVVMNARRGDDGVILEVLEQRNTKGSFVSRLARRFFVSRRLTTSIALAAAYEIVRQHGGRIAATVNVRNVLEFSVWLPLRPTYNGGGRQGVGSVER